MIEIKSKLLTGLLAGSIAFGSQIAKAEESSGQNKNWNLSLSAGYQTHFISTATGGVPVAGRSLQSEAILSNSEGLYFGVWGNKALEPNNDGLKTDEADIILGKETHFKGGVIVDFGVSNWHIIEKFKDETDVYNIFHPYLIVKRPIEIIAGITTPKIEFNANIPIDNKALTKNHNMVIGMSYEFPKILETNFGINGEFNRNDGSPGGNVFKGGVSAGWDIYDDVRISANYDYYNPQNIKDNHVYGFKLTKKF